MIIRYFKKRAIRQYLEHLPRLLTKDYGKQPSYTAMQVVRTIKRYRLNRRWRIYAVALFADEESYTHYAEKVHSPDSQTTLQEQIARLFRLMRLRDLADEYAEGDLWSDSPDGVSDAGDGD